MTVFPDDPWAAGQGTHEGRPLFVRVNTGAAVVRGEPSLRARVGIAVGFREPDKDGLPGAEELTRLSEVEDALSAALGVGSRAVHLLVITTAGMREFVYHTTTPNEVGDAVEGVASEFPEYRLHLLQEDDPDWSIYAKFSP